jgi:biotin transport system substrate-specific component
MPWLHPAGLASTAPLLANQACNHARLQGNIMSNVASQSLNQDLLGLKNRSLTWQAGAVVFGTAFLALSSYITVPMIPVPVTMQTFAVLLVGALYGARLGAITVVAWLLEGALGLPVLAGGAAGVAHFVGKTGGYLFAFPIAAALTGWLVERGWNGNRVMLAFAAMIIGHVVCLAFGAAWLAVLIGGKLAFWYGVVPFIVGTVLKSALGAATLKAMTRLKAAK